MSKLAAIPLWIILAIASCQAQTTANDGNFKLALPGHQGQLHWHADGFKIIESSAKPEGKEIGLRGSNISGRLTFLGFLILLNDQIATSAKCRDGALDADKKDNPSLKISTSSEMARRDDLPVEVVSYTAKGRDGKTEHMMRGFVASGGICGDLEIYSESPISTEAPDVKEIWSTYGLDPSYIPQFDDVLLYAQILYRNSMYKAAAPVFEQALTKLQDDKNKDQVTWRRVLTDQAGMSYGMSGDIRKARAIFEAALAKDPEYPMYYYNLACADAEENKLADARLHLQQAFAHKANIIHGETMPDPTKDGSFLPYRKNKDFWAFVQDLR